MFVNKSQFPAAPSPLPAKMNATLLRTSTSGRCAAVPARPAARRSVAARAHKVEILHEGKSTTITVPDGESILSVALDKGLDLPHDCKLGVCMTCPAKLVSRGGGWPEGWDLRGRRVRAAGGGVVL